MNIVNGLGLLLIGLCVSFLVFYAIIKAEEALEKDRKNNKNEEN